MDDSSAGHPDAAGPSVDAASRRFRTVAERVLDARLQATPEVATELGDHRFDDQLTDLSAAGVQGRVAMLSDALAALDDVDEAALPTGERVDLEILRTAVARDLWLLTELCEHERDPLVHLPGDGLYSLLSREVGEPAVRLRALAARMAAVPRCLEVARDVLHDMSRVHVETAIVQARGIVGMLGGELDALLAREPALHNEVEPARAAAVEALTGHLRWLDAQLPVSDGDPRLGEQPFAAKLWYTLDTETTPDSLLTRAESDLQAVEEAIAELASELDGGRPRGGQVREVLDRLAGQAPVTDATILGLCEQALAVTTHRVRELDLVSVPDGPVQIIVMPPVRRGVTVGYCDPPGPLEPPGPDGLPLPTFFAVSPTPDDWPPERVTSFYREYNGHLLRDLTVHEAMPGHWLQLAHANRFTGSTRVRAANWSGPFVEGWAVYAEALIAEAGLGLGDRLDAALRMQQLKMQLRSTINAILDVRVHTHGMTQDEAMELMTVRGHQEEGEAAGKWRRALLTSTQLSTYYVGYHEVRDLVQRLSADRPGATPRRLHDEVLAHGSPPPRHLRTLLKLP
jgi:uncharacterized protein (DUF885 family)